MRAANRPAWPAVMATVMDAQQVVSPVATKRTPGEDNHRSDLVQLGQPDRFGAVPGAGQGSWQDRTQSFPVGVIAEMAPIVINCQKGQSLPDSFGTNGLSKGEVDGGCLLSDQPAPYRTYHFSNGAQARHKPPGGGSQQQTMWRELDGEQIPGAGV